MTRTAMTGPIHRLAGIFLASMFCTLTLVPAAIAAPFTFHGADGDLEASVLFNVVGGELVVTLTNAFPGDVTRRSQILTGLFFDITGNPTLTPTTAAVADGSQLVQGTTVLGGAGTYVGDQWAYGANLDGAPHDASQGIAAAGFGLFDGANFGCDPSGNPCQDLNGVDYGLTSAGDDLTTGNLSNPKSNPDSSATIAVVQHAVVFTLGGIGLGFDPSISIFNVSFQYGSGFQEPNLVPEPGTLWLVGSGLALLAHRRWRRRR